MNTPPIRQVPRLFALASLLFTASAWAQGLPPVPVPPENPITEPKRVLGKILFWDEQLSSDNTVACATCHTPARAGTDGRRARLPGLDGLINTPDDTFGSPGVIRADSNDHYESAPFVQLAPQATTRAAQTALMAAYAPTNFWDGRAPGTFRDPVTNQVRIQNGGALESQAVGPPMSDVEMAHEGRDWAQISEKLATARPLALAANLPPDIADDITPTTTYPELFQRAFGDGAINPTRIAFAIATYERTTIPNQTPWDRFIAGDNTALTPGQTAGWNFFRNTTCNICHAAPHFTGNGFRNIGLRPPQEDLGRQIVTGNPADRGRFKVPSLRNVGLKNSFMHNGLFTSVPQVVGFYARAPGAPPQFPDNRDPIMQNTNVPPQVAPALQDFLINGLTDPRVATRTFPFDHPDLWSTRPGNRPVLLPGGVPGSGGLTPQFVSAPTGATTINIPPFIGNLDFKLGVMNALGGASARLAVSFDPPVNGRVAEDKVIGPFILTGAGNGSGLATAHLPIPANGTLAGRSLFVQWIVIDPNALGGIALSAPARVTFFCGSTGCPAPCIADVDDGSSIGLPDGGVTIDDLIYFLSAFEAGLSSADVDDGSSTGTPDGGVTIDDLLYYLFRFESGC